MNRGGALMRFVAIQGDITDQETDAIVNAANPTLLGGGGVDEAIHACGGPEILEECRWIRQQEWPDGLPPGRAVVTTGGLLKARHVIHTVGPIWSGGTAGEDGVLAECYRSSLRIACAMKLSSISFPSISTGAYGFPLRRACPIAVKSVREFVAELKSERPERGASPVTVEEIRFVLFTEHDLKVYLEQIHKLISPAESGSG